MQTLIQYLARMMPIIAFLLTGCVTIPDAIKSNSPTPQQDLARVMTQPALFVGQEARFGGRVINISNHQGATQLEIVAHPLDEGARPIFNLPSTGRIYADLPGFVEPDDFRGRYVTVVGNIKGTKQGQIGKVDYLYLVVSVRGVQRWQISKQMIMPPQPVVPMLWYGNGPHREGYWGPAPWGYYNAGPIEEQTILVPN